LYDKLKPVIYPLYFQVVNLVVPFEDLGDAKPSVVSASKLSLKYFYNISKLLNIFKH